MRTATMPIVFRLITSLFIIMLLAGCEPEPKPQNSTLVIDTSLCQFKGGSCSKTIDDIEINLMITPWSAPSEKPLNILINSSMDIKNVQMRIEGRDMFMGVIPVNLTQVSESQFNGSAVYGSCSSNYMVWRAIVSFETDNQEKFVIFDFLADNDKFEKA